MDRNSLSHAIVGWTAAGANLAVTNAENIDAWVKRAGEILTVVVLLLTVVSWLLTHLAKRRKGNTSKCKSCTVWDDE